MFKRNVRLALAMASLRFAVLSDADAAVADGYWAVKTGAEPVVLGYVVPSYSTNEFVAFWMTCSRGAVSAFVDFPVEDFKDGQTYDVEMVVNGGSHRLPARAVFSDMHQYALLEADLDRNAPPLTTLANAKTVRVNVKDKGFDLSTKELHEGLKQFLTACPRR